MSFLRNLFSKPPISDEERAQAKEIFFKYSCNETNMARAGENFSKYRISDEQKADWRKEFITRWKSKLSVDDLTAVEELGTAQAIEAVPDLLDIAEDGDSWAKLRIAGAIRSAGIKYGIDENLRKEMLEIVSRLCESIIEGQIQLSERHRNIILSFHPNALKNRTPEEFIVDHANFMLDDAKDKTQTNLGGSRTW